METCCSVGVLTTETDVIPRERRRDANFLSLVSSMVSFPHKLFQEYIAASYIENLFSNDRPQYDKVKSEILSRCQEFRYLLYFVSALGNELGLDIIQGLIDSAPHFVMDYTPEAYRMASDDHRYRDFCVDVAFECHTEEAARAVGKRWKEYKLSSDVAGYEQTNSKFEYQTEEGARAVGERLKKYELSSYSPEHTNSGVAFMVRFNQVPSLVINSVKCGRTVSRDLAEGMCSRSVLRTVHIYDSQFHVDFYNILGADFSDCEIQDLTLYYGKDHHDLWHQSSSGGDLARWVFAMPHLSNFCLKCPYLPDSFLSTAVTSASSCQIHDLMLDLSKGHEDLKNQSSGGGDLARWVCTMPSLRKFKLSWLYLPDGFLSTAIALASSCQIRNLVLNFRSGFGDSKSHSHVDSQYQSSLGGDLVRWVCALPNLTKFSLRCPYLTDDFLSAAAASASSCQIQVLHLIFGFSIKDDSQYQSSMGDDLAKWVFDTPRLSSFRLACPYMPDTFLSTAVTSASSCQISELSLHPLGLLSSLVSESGAANLAEFLCRLPNLTRAVLNSFKLPETFFTTISSQASRSKVECITISDKPLRSFLSDNQGVIQTPSDDSGSEDESSQETDQGSGQENFPAPDESETNKGSMILLLTINNYYVTPRGAAVFQPGPGSRDEVVEGNPSTFQAMKCAIFHQMVCRDLSMELLLE
ncbi:LOW QUALITY PROTEIN: uncharacterized protein [Diadema setosum]|uniref:LOW QUALITY PROTEIN: uncharacterized protein n=1 Tax=Diadema setosum TaxID=31175 RepID=UPI003B3BC212